MTEKAPNRASQEATERFRRALEQAGKRPAQDGEKPAESPEEVSLSEFFSGSTPGEENAALPQDSASAPTRPEARPTRPASAATTSSSAPTRPSSAATSSPAPPRPSPAAPRPGSAPARPSSATTTTNASSARPPATRPQRPQRPPPPASARPVVAPASAQPQLIYAARQPANFSAALGCLARALLTGLFTLLLAGLCGFSILFYQYYRIAATLPSINDLRQRASQFETTRILDRNGNTLYEVLDPNAGRRTYIPLKQISPALVAATIATEDKGYYSHPGFDVFAIVRAFYQNYTSGETVSGASTITQQLARALLFSPEERTEKSYQRKMREAILAAEITRRYSKDEILELYLNEIYYGNLAYGVEAAAETYFNTTADKLTLGQAAFLAGLPQAPAIYDVFTAPDATFRRMEDVMVLMYQLSQEQDCIEVSNSPDKVCVDPVTITKAIDEVRNYPFKPPAIQMRYPHWVNYVRSLLEAQFDAQTIYRSGFSVITTIDPNLQDLAQAALSEQVAQLAGQNAKSGAVVALRPVTGEILAMVGSADFYNEAISGQVNMAINPRQPGSAIKPLTYVAAFEKGWTPATLLWDVPSEFPASGRPDDMGPTYQPVNYDGRFHGPVTLRFALANSYNIPAVKALQYVGIYDDPATPAEDGLIAFARRLGITTLNRPDYGLSLTLGGGEVTLLELTNVYAVFANSGRRIPPVAILRITDKSGKVVYDYQQPPGEQVIRTEHAYLISSILADNTARAPAFGANSPLNLAFPAAVKTGTTNDFRDNWAVGYTPDLAVGVWVGNPDYTPMQNTSGVSGAAPVWNRVMTQGMPLVVPGNQTPFSRPPGIVDMVICEVSGALPSQWCPKQRSEIFAADQPPLPKSEDLWRKVAIDTWTGLAASPACSEFTEEKFVMNVQDTWARRWLRRDPQGVSLAERLGFPPPVTFAPERECRANDPQPSLQFAAPRDGDTIQQSPLYIYAVIDAPQDFDFWRLEYGFGEKPVEWRVLEQSRQRYRQPDIISMWNVDNFPPDVITLRLFMRGAEGQYAERRVRVFMQIPTPTPLPTATEAPTPLPTWTLPFPTETAPPPLPTELPPLPTWLPTLPAPPVLETAPSTP